ncbi:MAG: dTDP-4-dehydrorhamnose reductase [Clostridia bacterium]|nr:dTDP-4-dehydrorhamnose reductase [Clostridia bacterium]
MIIVTGAAGQLGGDVCRLLKEKGIPHKGIDKADVDITSESAVKDYFGSTAFDVLIHCAAYTAVDKAEQEKELCYAVNAKGTENLARLCRDKKAAIIYISTDYVFPGEGEAPYGTDDEKAPLSVYGKSKHEGEKAVISLCEKYFIVRTSWVFGEENRNFIATMLRLSQTRSEVNVIYDQVGSPTYSADLAVLLTEMAQTEKYGVYHATNEGFCSWYELAKKVFDYKKIPVKVNPVTSEQYITPAERPKNSRLSKSSLTDAGFSLLPRWEDAVERYLDKKSE